MDLHWPVLKYIPFRDLKIFAIVFVMHLRNSTDHHYQQSKAFDLDQITPQSQEDKNSVGDQGNLSDAPNAHWVTKSAP